VKTAARHPLAEAITPESVYLSAPARKSENFL
jgi:hypothetical protein